MSSVEESRPVGVTGGVDQRDTSKRNVVLIEKQSYITSNKERI